MTNLTNTQIKLIIALLLPIIALVTLTVLPFVFIIAWIMIPFARVDRNGSKIKLKL